MINIGTYRDLWAIEKEWRDLLNRYLFLTKRKNKNEYFKAKSCRFSRALGKQKLTANLRRILNDYQTYFNDISIGRKMCLKKWSQKKISRTERSTLNNIFKPLYEDFTKLYGYDILKMLDIRTCPYCNRNYTFTMNKTKKGDFQTRPEFDHFYDKATYPLLALSFYNLVPSCHTCNHGKGNKPAWVNPYFEGFRSKFRIKSKSEEELSPSDILAIKDESEISLEFDNPSKAEETNISTFGLETLYNEHRDYVMEMIEKANAYTTIQNANLVDAFQGVNRHPQDVFDFVWGKYLQDAELEKRPLSKLTKDILEQLNIKK